MSQYPHVKRNKRTGKLSYRRPIPADARSAFDGRHEVKKSFGTASLEEALPAYHEIAAVADGTINTARTVASIKADALAPTESVGTKASEAEQETHKLLDRYTHQKATIDIC